MSSSNSGSTSEISTGAVVSGSSVELLVSGVDPVVFSYPVVGSF